jgi:hypothetical protein
MDPNDIHLPIDILITWVVKYCDRGTRCALRFTCKPLREAVLKRAVRCEIRPGLSIDLRRLPVKSIADAPRVRCIIAGMLGALSDDDIVCLVKAPMLRSIVLGVSAQFHKPYHVMRNTLTSKGVSL